MIMNHSFVFGCVCLLLTLLPCFSICPNSCSGHGTCGQANACNCYPGWNGGAADCSQRSCPNGTAWADKAYRTDAAHQSRECSNAGDCDRSTGLCKCFPGFTGSACQRVSCPNDCSGHGVCSTMHDISLYIGPDYDSRMQSSGDGVGILYNNWDSSYIQLCECDIGYFGADCSLAMCPKGDDPLTLNQNFRSIRWQIFIRGAFQGQIGLQFQGSKIFLPYAGLTSQACSDILSYNGKFGLVNCKYSKFGTDRITIDLTFYNWPIYPKDNNLYQNNGNPSIYDFFCDITYSNPSTYCQFYDLVASNIIEYSYCSQRGNCDYSSGVCSCFNGFGGPACSNATYLYSADGSASPGLLVNSKALNFSSSVLQIQTAKSPSSDFYLLQALANSNTMFFVRGDGLVGINKLKTLSGGQTVSGGGLYVEEGGCTIVDSGLNVFSSSSSTPVLSIGSKYSGALSTSYSALQITSLSTSANNFYLINGLNQGRSTFSVRGDGAVFVRGGGIQVTSGATIYSRGLTLTGGLSVNNGGVRVQQGGIALSGGITVTNQGIVVSSGGVQIYGGTSIYSGGLKVAAGTTILSGGLSVTGGVSINNNGLRVTGGLTVFNGGLDVSGGGTIRNQGLRVSGGFTVYSGGGVLTGGFTVANAGLAVTDGIRVTGGLTVFNSFLATSGGVTVASNGGLQVFAGLSVLSGPVFLTDGLTVGNTGLVVSGGLTVLNSGIRVATGGLSVFSDGLFSSAGATLNGNTYLSAITVASNAMFDSAATFKDGVVITGGLTVSGPMWFENSPSYSDRRLKTNIEPISNALEKVSRLKGVYYSWIQNEASGMRFDEDRHLGVIAQEVQKVIPEVVKQSSMNRYFTVDYVSLVPLLIEAIRDLEGLLEEVRRGWNETDSEVQELRKTLASLRSTD